MTRPVLLKIVAVGSACAAVGAGAGILGTAGAATSNPPSQSSQATKHHRHHRSLLLRAVHADAVIPVKGGQFAQVTYDRGVVQSVSGQQLTVADGTLKHTYKTVTLTIPANAKVRDNKQTAQLSDVKSGQIVVVIQGPAHTWVMAHDPRKA